MAIIKLLHGTNHIIEKPMFLFGNDKNDYGIGFYCTKLPEMAKEWACKNNEDGFINEYEFDDEGLKVLNFLDGKHSVLNWIAILLKNRSFKINNAIEEQAREYIINNFLVDTTGYDIIVGYRADDSYFAYAQDFVSNTLPLKSLSKALELGKLGEQTVLISKKAFERIKFIAAEPVAKEIYYPKFKTRDGEARRTYKEELSGDKSVLDDIFVLDIIRGKIKNDDPRIQRIIFK